LDELVNKLANNKVSLSYLTFYGRASTIRKGPQRGSLAQGVEPHLDNLSRGPRVPSYTTGTTDQLVTLETYICKAFVGCKHVVLIFFNLEKAYDMTWKLAYSIK